MYPAPNYCGRCARARRPRALPFPGCLPGCSGGPTQAEQAITEPLGHRSGRNPQQLGHLPRGVSGRRQQHGRRLRLGRDPRPRWAGRLPTARSFATPGFPEGHQPGRPGVVHRSAAHGAAPRHRHDPFEPAALSRAEPRRGSPHLQQHPRGHLLGPGLIGDDPATAVHRAGDLITEGPESLGITACNPRQQIIEHRHGPLPSSSRPPPAPYPPGGDCASAQPPWLFHRYRASE